MRMARFRWQSLLLIGAVFSCINQAAAEDDHELAKKLSDSGEILALEEIVRHARSAKSGELLETDLEHKQGRYIYEVEILDKAGQVWEVKLDAASGQLIEMERDD